MSLGRSVLATVAGVVGAGLTIAGVEALAHGALDGDALFAAVALGYGLGAFVGSGIAWKIRPTRGPALAVGVTLAVLAVSNLFALEHPPWFAPAAAAALVAGSFAAWRLWARPVGR